MENANQINTEQIWLDHKAGLEYFIRSKVKEDSDAEDIIQEVFLKIHLNHSFLKDPAKLRSWIYQITRNTIQDYFRKKRFSLDIEQIDIIEERNNIDLDKFHNCMIPFINKLPEKYREALLYSDLRNLSQLDLARKLGMSYSGAKSRVQRARRLLHSNLTDCCHIVSDKYGNIISTAPKGQCICETR